jgi:hypothetical protein
MGLGQDIQNISATQTNGWGIRSANAGTGNFRINTLAPASPTINAVTATTSSAWPRWLAGLPSPAPVKSEPLFH